MSNIRATVMRAPARSVPATAGCGMCGMTAGQAGVGGRGH